jgi:hypothetical protein
MEEGIVFFYNNFSFKNYFFNELWYVPMGLVGPLLTWWPVVDEKNNNFQILGRAVENAMFSECGRSR